jgi:hypothetical protein
VNDFSGMLVPPYQPTSPLQAMGQRETYV